MSEATKPKHFLKAGIAALVLIAAFVAALEYHWRSKGYQLSYNDDKMLWASVRRQVYEPADKSTVFIGSSRGKYDIDIETWEKLTGEKAVQLSVVGSSPRLVLFDLADDEKFAGKLIIDITETLFFPTDYVRTERLPREVLEYYHNESPAQRATAALGIALESKLILLEESKFGLDQVFKEYGQANNRAGVAAPPIPFKKEYTLNTERRQAKFTPWFINHPELIKIHMDNWEKRSIVNRAKMTVPKGAGLDSFLITIKNAFDKIRSRGGTIFLLRLPSDRFHLRLEKKYLPRNEYWERLLQFTNTPGIHFADYPAVSGLICTEASHLSPTDAIKYTSFLVNTLRTEFGWKFPNSTNTPNGVYGNK
jgi:hypothetical protein